MIKNPAYRIIIACVVFFFIAAGSALAIEDGFGRARKIESKHFIIYYDPDLELSSLTRQLNVDPLDELLEGKPGKEERSADSELAGMLDTLFIQVCNILDMHLYSFSGTIKICRDSAQLNKIYHTLFNKSPGRTTRSFYAYNINTIYTSADNFKVGIIGHEIAHAIITHYFVVLPPEKIQEVLSAYVEFQLRSAAQ